MHFPTTDSTRCVTPSPEFYCIHLTGNGTIDQYSHGEEGSEVSNWMYYLVKLCFSTCRQIYIDANTRSSKLRKVKCDEEKPVCRRCRTARQVCDGYAVVQQYDGPSKTRRPHPNSRIQQLPTGSISGTENERRFFSTFKTATESGVALHVGHVSSFWSVLAPRLAHHDAAIKHAVVALGAAYHYFKTTNEGSTSVVTNRYRPAYYGHVEKVECFVIQNYNLAISKLQAHIDSPGPETIIIVLTCCLVFICIENLRFNHTAAMAHLENGVQIISRSFDLQSLFRPSSTLGPPAEHKSISPIVSNDELQGMVRYFCNLEISEHLFAYDVPLVLATHLQRSASTDADIDMPDEFTSLDQAHGYQWDLVNDIHVYDRQTTLHRGNVAYWSSDAAIARHTRISKRAYAVYEKYEAFVASSKAPAVGTRELAGCYQDLVQILCVKCMVDMMPVAASAQTCGPYNLAAVLANSEKFLVARRAFTAKSGSPLDFTAETGIVAPLYFVCVYTADPVLAATARRLLSQCSAREGPWDGRSLLRLMERRDVKEKAMQLLATKLDPLPKWGSNLDCYGLYSELELTEW